MPLLGEVAFTILNPAVVLALTVLAIEPSLLVTVEPLAFQFQATKEALFSLTAPDVPRVNPSLVIVLTREALPLSSLLLFVAIYPAPTPLTESMRIWENVLLLLFIQIQSG